MKIGTLIYEARRKANLSQLMLAQLAKVSSGDISRIENHKLKTGTTVDKLIEYLKIDENAIS